MNVIDFEHYSNSEDPIFALVYGASGTGKTHLMGTVGELGKTLLIDIDKGFKTVAFAADLAKARENITITSFDSFGDLDTAYKLVDKNDPDTWNNFFKQELVQQPFDWVIWDTWSEIQWYMSQQLRKNEQISGTGLNFRKNLQIQHWGALTDLNKLAIETLRNCKVNQIFTMQETMTRDELSGQITGGPAIHGKLVQEMPAYFDVVVHTYVDIQGRFIGSTKPKGKWPAKTRLSENAEIVNPTAKKLFAV
jgi:hypothetical protein